jgi:hypothetical protein
MNLIFVLDKSSVDLLKLMFGKVMRDSNGVKSVFFRTNDAGALWLNQFHYIKMFYGHCPMSGVAIVCNVSEADYISVFR